MSRRDQKTKAAKPAAKAATSARGAPARAKPAAKTKNTAKTIAKPAPKAAAALKKAAPVKAAAAGRVASAPPAVAPKAKAVSKAIEKPSSKKLVDRAKASKIVLPPDYQPSEDEPFMNEYQRLYFRQKLLNWREEIIRQTKETLEGLHEDSVQHADLADRATSETDRALELRARDRQRKLVAKIDAALARIEDGTYGYCEETGEPIGLKRLDARPIATLSLEAQERHERRERVYRED
jgi:DnaK suppressor protein